MENDDKDKKDEDRSCFFREAYNMSYTDIYDFASTKQSLKKCTGLLIPFTPSFRTIPTDFFSP